MTLRRRVTLAKLPDTVRERGCESAHCRTVGRSCFDARYVGEVVDPDGVVIKARLCSQAAARFAGLNELSFPLGPHRESVTASTEAKASA
jgi:hypothetical protein